MGFACGVSQARGSSSVRVSVSQTCHFAWPEPRPATIRDFALHTVVILGRIEPQTRRVGGRRSAGPTRGQGRGHQVRRSSFVRTAALVLASGCGPVPSAAPSPSATTFVVPRPTEQPITRKPLARASFAHPALAPELESVFELVYRARTLPLGGHFDVDGLRGLVDGAYADYTLPLFDREVRDAQAGTLQQVSFTGIAVSDIEEVLAFVACPPSCSAFASVTRTRVEVRAGAAPTHETATYKFALRRDLVGADGVSWVVYDFVNPATGGWISKPPPISDAQAA